MHCWVSQDHCRVSPGPLAGVSGPWLGVLRPSSGVISGAQVHVQVSRGHCPASLTHDRLPQDHQRCRRAAPGAGRAGRGGAVPAEDPRALQRRELAAGPRPARPAPPGPPRPAAAHSCGGAGRGRWLGAAPARRLPPGLGACERRQRQQGGGGGGASAMRWPRGPCGAWRLLPRRSLLAALFLFSLSSSFLYFVYVAPGIGKRRAETRGAGLGARHLRLETLSNPRRAGPGAAASPAAAARAVRCGPARRLRGAPALGAGQRVSASRRPWGEPAAGGALVAGCAVPTRALRGGHTRGCRSPLPGGTGRAPRGAPRAGGAGAQPPLEPSRGRRPACPRVCLGQAECCPSVCGLNSRSGGNPTLFFFVKWDD